MMLVRLILRRMEVSKDGQVTGDQLVACSSVGFTHRLPDRVQLVERLHDLARQELPVHHFKGTGLMIEQNDHLGDPGNDNRFLRRTGPVRSVFAETHALLELPALELWQQRSPRMEPRSLFYG